jgi:hypothetical protein
VLVRLVNVDLLYSLQQVILDVENKCEICKMRPVMIPAFMCFKLIESISTASSQQWINNGNLVMRRT